MTTKKEMTVLKSVVRSSILIYSYIGLWFVINSISLTNGANLLNLVSCTILLIALLAPLFNSRYEMVFLWYRKSFKNKIWYWIWGGFINSIYIGLAYLLFQAVKLIFKLLHSM